MSDQYKDYIDQAESDEEDVDSVTSDDMTRAIMEYLEKDTLSDEELI